MKPVSNKVSSVIISERREHSRKPDEIRDKIVELLEIFHELNYLQEKNLMVGKLGAMK